jgi:outer membrane protein
MYKIVSLFLILILGLSATVNAQDSSFVGLPISWRLEDCIAYAKNNNILLATIRLTVKSVQEDLLQAKANILPNLASSVSQTVVNSNQALANGTLQNQVNFSSNYGLSSSMVLYNGNYLKNDIRSKEYSVQSSNLDLLENENNLTLSITQAYFNVLLAKEIMVAFESVLSTSKGQVKQGQDRFEAGGLSKKDFLLLSALLASDEYNLIKATNDFKLNTVILKQYLLLPTSYDFITLAPKNTIPDFTSIPLSEAQSIARQTRPEIRNKSVLIKKSEIELEKTKAGKMPIINAGAAIASGYAYNQGNFYFVQLGNNFYESLGITIGIPIYSRRLYRTNINKAKLLLQQSNLNLLDTKIVLDQLVEQTFLNLQNAKAQYSSADYQLNTATEIYKISNEQLILGDLNTVDLLLQKNIYVQSLQLFVQAKYRLALYNKIYTFYMGIPVSF